MQITIDGKVCEAEYGEFILTVARRNGIHIPTLCHNEALPGQANCRLCLVEVLENGRPKIVVSCVYPISQEVEVVTNNETIRRLRKTIVKLLAARVPGNTYLQKLLQEFSVPRPDRFQGDPAENCVLCGLCVKACEKVGSAAIATVNRGIAKKVSTPYDEPSPPCIGCGACAQVCPTGAIAQEDKGNERTIWQKKFELLSCLACGEYFTTKEQLEYIRNKVGPTDDDRLCEKCKKAAAAKKLRDIYGLAVMK